MILHVNHLQPGVAAAAGETVGALLALVEEAATGDRLAQVCGNLKARALLAVAAALRARVDTRGRVRRGLLPMLIVTRTLER